MIRITSSLSDTSATEINELQGIAAAGNFAYAVGSGTLAIFEKLDVDTLLDVDDSSLVVDADSNVGVGTVAPSSKLEVVGTVTATQFAGDGSLLTGISSLAASDGDPEPALSVDAQGQVGIGTETPGFTLEVIGTAAKIGGGSWSTASDARLKTLGLPFARGLEALENVNPIFYRYRANSPLRLPSATEHVGLVAQEVQKAIPEAVEMSPSGFLHLNNDPIIWTMLNAIKELKAENDELRRKLRVMDQMAGRLDEIEARLR